MHAEAPEFYERAGGHALWRAPGTLRLPEVVQRITAAITHARTTGVRRLLVDVTALTGQSPPQFTARYRFIREWAHASGGLVRLAIAAPVELIEPDRIGLIVAANAGLIANIFEDTPAALAWLLSEA